MAQRYVVVGGGAAGIGAAGAIKGVDREADLQVFTEYEDAAYSPCGIPYVHGREIDSFERLFLQGKEYYKEQGIDIRYETRVGRIDLSAREIELAPLGQTPFDTERRTDEPAGGGERIPFDKLIVATGFDYEAPDIPGTDLEGQYYVKNIRRAMEWDKVLDDAKSVVVLGASPLGLEMITSMAHRGLETHVVDPHPWALAEAADPDIVEPVQESWTEMGVTMHFNTKAEALVGEGRVRGVKTSEGEIPCDLVIICTHKRPNNRLAAEAGLKIGSTGGIVVDEGMRASVDGVFAAGDVAEIPHGLTKLPLQGLSGSHAYAQGKVAGTNAAGGDRAYRPVYVPWGMVAGKWMIGGVSFGESTATALGIPFVMGVAQGISRARYYPDSKMIKVKLLAEPGTLRLIGAQMVGGEGIKERADFLAMCARKGITLGDLATMENVYSPPIGALGEPISAAAQNALTEQGLW
ncbi:MAG TPA: FAD-dependent oxidoreductase [Actinomycetota bacterium]